MQNWHGTLPVRKPRKSAAVFALSRQPVENGQKRLGLPSADCYKRLTPAVARCPAFPQKCGAAFAALFRYDGGDSWRIGRETERQHGRGEFEGGFSRYLPGAR